MESIFNYTEENLESLLIQEGFKKFNVSQILNWIYKKKIYDFNKMTNLNKSLIEFLKENFCMNLLEIVKEEVGKETNKYLIELEDKNIIECVLMFHDYGKSLCISSQIGCNMGCIFCESGKLKKVRNLTTSEMILQILTIENIIGTRIDNVVIMGIGEPFDNYENVINFLKIASNPKMIELGMRKITISTCGLIPKIYDFADLKLGVNLAISLHASNDEIRDKLMPINKKYNILNLMQAIDYYIEKTNRRVTIEYILLKDINDNAKHAKELSILLKNKLVYVNLIPYNETNNNLKRSEVFKINKFYDILMNDRIKCTIRREMGSNLSAACGQLRAQVIKEDLC